MKRLFILRVISLLVLSGVLIGCGGGSGGTPDPDSTPTPSPSPTPSSRTALEVLLSGNSATGSRRWRFIAMKPNDKYFPAPGHTSDQEPCGSAYFQTDPDDKFLHTRVCGVNDTVEFRADGKSRVRLEEAFAQSWSLRDSPNGPTLSCPLMYSGKAGDPPVTGNYVLTNDGPTGNTAVFRIRLKVLDEAQAGKPGLIRTAGFEYVLESFGGTQ
jgi:hypothetical protein